ncbi:maleylpyruvate isomerase family mycothiol-dependent enzyme [Actinacidiphila bryophytorum]|uniref:Maleylpyruvate isomerase, mycothiol-dependent n=1 Tax=Actinacidiphila bryophytorum TaxID=1436133 RepID=A0A9W4E568_9ACTN|nr:maleylpyruvate isomerase family mycothiol-dependent enzyme [Actinacidiphila bryophytorum]MBM9436166.1 maleylpyruvate isomerase family mycothiol-dependent enzyme [Actinacidiphila bryophytorum]MBN6545502.1 maleylpyruvate isomerase family mycothiol-dependent enzyme [Actinacidiphila bryophytorum]CAG7633558.1 Maleylpyruvate isomerase, mycothiol-dependent [Actinacidiphila bryophytorum]
MTVQRPDPDADAAEVAAATEQLLDTAAKLSAEELAGPSLLPGWSRGHVLSHIARNADALVNLLTWAGTGEETPMYADEATRDRDIETGAGRPPAEQLADLRQSADRFADAVAALPPAAWATQVAMRSGRVVAAAEIPWRRLIEVRLHHVDLDAGHSPDDLPADFADRELAWVVDGLTAHEGVAAVRLRDTGTGSSWDLGAAEEPELTVSGPARALLAWVSGRSSGGGLDVSPAGAVLPVLPPLG